MESPLNLYYYSDNIIIFIFLIAGVCVGLPALLWALYVLHNHRKNGGQISAFIVLLLLNDLLELLLSFCIVLFIYFDSNDIYTPDPVPLPDSDSPYNAVYDGVYALWATFKIGGLYLHQMVALQSILFLKNPACSANIFSPACSVFLGIILWLVLLVCQLIEHQLLANLVLCILPLCVLEVTCICTCEFFRDYHHVPHSGVKPGSAVLIVSTLTLLATCVPSVTMFVYAYKNQQESKLDRTQTVSAFLVSMRVVSDPILCVLVCKERLGAQTQQSHTEFNTDRQSASATTI